MNIAGVRMARTGWWPDRATVGLVIAGFFGVGLLGFALSRAGMQLGEAITGTFTVTPSPNSTVMHIPIPTAQRVLAASDVASSILLGVAGLGGLLIALRIRAGTVVAVIGLSLAAVGQLVTIAAVAHESSGLETPTGFFITSAMTIAGYVALAVVLGGGLPVPRITPSEPAGPVSVP